MKNLNRRLSSPKWGVELWEPEAQGRRDGVAAVSEESGSVIKVRNF